MPAAFHPALRTTLISGSSKKRSYLSAALLSGGRGGTVLWGKGSQHLCIPLCRGGAAGGSHWGFGEATNRQIKEQFLLPDPPLLGLYSSRPGVFYGQIDMI